MKHPHHNLSFLLLSLFLSKEAFCIDLNKPNFAVHFDLSREYFASNSSFELAYKHKNLNHLKTLKKRRGDNICKLLTKDLDSAMVRSKTKKLSESDWNSRANQDRTSVHYLEAQTNGEPAIISEEVRFYQSYYYANDARETWSSSKLSIAGAGALAFLSFSYLGMDWAAITAGGATAVYLFVSGSYVAEVTEEEANRIRNEGGNVIMSHPIYSQTFDYELFEKIWCSQSIN